MYSAPTTAQHCMYLSVNFMYSDRVWSGPALFGLVRFYYIYTRCRYVLVIIMYTAMKQQGIVHVHNYNCIMYCIMYNYY